MFFECNFPTTVPAHIKGELSRNLLSDVLATVHERMGKLEDALHLSGLRGEDFAAAIRPMFQPEETAQQIDLITVEDLADAAILLARGKRPAPSRYDWPNAIVLVDTAFVSRREWEQLRMLGLGGSDAAIVMRTSPYRTALDLFYDKTGRPVKMDEEDPGREFIFSFGHKVESLVVEEFCRRTGAVVVPETRMFAKKGAEFMTANIDAIVELPSGDLYVFEAKTTTFYNRDAWDNNKVPRHYIPQCYQYPTVLDDERIKGTYIGCVFGNTPNDFACSRINLDADAIAAQIEEERKFWTDHVLAGNAPAFSGNPEQDIETLRKFEIGHAKTDSEPLKFNASDADIRENIHQWMSANEDLKEKQGQAAAIKEKRDAISVNLIRLLGDHTSATMPRDDDFFFEVSYAPRSRTVTDMEQLRLAYPDAFEACVHTNPESSRVFSIKEKRIKKTRSKMK